jgi:hypothetical protein
VFIGSRRFGSCPTAVALAVLALSSIGAAGAPVDSGPNPAAAVIGRDLPSMPELGGRAVKGLAYTVGILLIASSLYKRFVSKKPLQPGPAIEIHSRKNLSARVGLVIVEVDGRRFLLSQGAEQAQLIAELDSPAEIAALAAEPQIRVVHE